MLASANGGREGHAARAAAVSFAWLSLFLFAAARLQADPLFEQVDVTHPFATAALRDLARVPYGLIAANAALEFALALGIMLLCGWPVRARWLLLFAILFAPAGYALDWLVLWLPAVLGLHLVAYWAAAGLLAAFLCWAVLRLQGRAVILFGALFALVTAPYGSLLAVWVPQTLLRLGFAVAAGAALLALLVTAALGVASLARGSGRLRRGMGGALAASMVLLAITAGPVAYAIGKGTGEQRCADNMALIANALQRYHADTGRYPESLEDLAPRYLRGYRLRCPVDWRPGGKARYGYRTDTRSGFPLIKCEGRHQLLAGIDHVWGRDQHRVLYFVWQEPVETFDVCTSDRYGEREFVGPSPAPPLTVNGVRCEPPSGAGLVGGRLVVPVWWVQGITGADLDWDPATHTATLRYADREVLLTTDDAEAAGPMTIQATLDYNHLVVSADRLIGALGGTIAYHDDPPGIAIDLPPVRILRAWDTPTDR